MRFKPYLDSGSKWRSHETFICPVLVVNFTMDGDSWDRDISVNPVNFKRDQNGSCLRHLMVNKISFRD